MRRLVALAVVLAAGFLLFYSGARTPTPLPADAPADVFSAGRAMRDDAAMAPVPHAVGTPQNAKVRDYLVGRMTALGLAPQVQRDHSQGYRVYGGETYAAGAEVENVIGLLPGRDRRLPALALMAHYDSVPGSPGAADDIAGVSSALEILRVIKAHGTPARDVMLVITDGEEAGLLGANAFFADNPLARHIGFILNMESRGGGGRAAMFETGAGNGPAIDLYRKTALRPSANSLTVFIYKHLPNDTDYTVAKAHDAPGLNFAFIGRQFDYHSPSSTVAALDQGSLQHMGDEVAGVARALAFSTVLPARGADAVYGSLFGWRVLAYPAFGGWILLGAIAVLLAIAAWRAHRREPLAWLDVLQGAGATLLVLTASALALHLARHATGIGFGWMPGRALLARFPAFEVAMALAGLGALLLVAAGLGLGRVRLPAAVLAVVAGLAASLFGGFDAVGLGEGVASGALALMLLGRSARLGGGWLGLLLVGFVAALALQVAAPTIGFLVAWPLAAATLCAVLLALGEGEGRAAWLCALVIFALVVAWAGDLFHLLLQALDVPELPLVPLWLGALALWPLLWPGLGARPWRAVPGAALVALSLALALGLQVTSPWSARHPSAAEPLYLVDHDAGRAYRVSPFEPDPWARAVLAADGGQIERRSFPTFRQPVWAAPAPLAPVAAPAVSVTHAADGLVTLHAGLAAADHLNLDLRVDTAVHDVRVDGQPMPILAQPGQWAHLRWQAAPEGVTVTFRPDGPGVLEARYAHFTPDWPATIKPLPPVPAKVMAWDLAGSTVVAGSVRARW